MAVTYFWKAPQGRFDVVHSHPGDRHGQRRELPVLADSNGLGISAGHDLTVTAGQLSSANGNVALAAGHDLNLAAAQEDHSSYRDTVSRPRCPKPFSPFPGCFFEPTLSRRDDECLSGIPPGATYGFNGDDIRLFPGMTRSLPVDTSFVTSAWLSFPVRRRQGGKNHPVMNPPQMLTKQGRFMDFGLPHHTSAGVRPSRC